MRVEDIIALIEGKKAEVARDTLEQPGSGERIEYAFGRAVGMYAGLELAKEAILEFYRDRAARDSRL